MNNRVDTTLRRSALLGPSAHTEALFQTWMQQALVSMAVAPSELAEGQTALMTLAPHECEDGAPLAPTVASTHQATHFPNTTCTLNWQSGRWVIASMSSLTHIEETASPCCEHAFWFGQETVGYQLQWAPMRREALVIALQAWEQQLQSVSGLVIDVSLALDNQEHDITLCVSP
ncbi:hypothetical protein K8D10_00970 [Aeromonas veronii]|uniref:hypothetical protein n=1 Tax=Aeromonas veronii TaxID=654 RepID=UPI00207C4CF9|nr:hypothetical protein [Aeromonas veronii]MCO4170373.1 hypothetical protein [Aeromonas veronii]